MAVSQREGSQECGEGFSGPDVGAGQAMSTHVPVTGPQPHATPNCTEGHGAPEAVDLVRTGRLPHWATEGLHLTLLPLLEAPHPAQLPLPLHGTL